MHFVFAEFDLFLPSSVHEVRHVVVMLFLCISVHIHKVIIRHMKSIFAEQGIPSQLETDDRPQCSLVEFKHFVNDYGVEHITKSPEYPQ